MTNKKDFRPEDIKILSKYNISFDWVREWESKLCRDSDNQTLWHLSRLSYLAGYLKAKERRERAVCEAKRECCETKVSQETAVREAKEEVERSLIKRFRTKPQLSQTAKDANQKVCSKAKARQVSPTESSKLEGDTQVN